MVKNKQKKESQKFPGKNIHAYAIIAVLIIIVYGGTVKHDFVVDDRIVISENKNVQKGIAAIPSIFSKTTFYGFIKGDADKTYRPVTLSSYAIEIEIFGLNPGLHHLFNVIYYILLCALIYIFLANIILPRWNKIFVLISTLFFVLHPIHTEVVSNIKSRDEILCFLFFIVSILFLFRYLKTKRHLHIIMAAIAYTASLFSKETAVTFILLFPLILFFNSDLKFKEILKLSLIFTIPLLVFFLCRYLVVKDIQSELTYVNNGILAFEGTVNRYTVIFYILLLYLKLLLIPYPLIWDYSYGHFETSTNVTILAIVSFIIYTGFIVYGIWAIRQRKLPGFLLHSGTKLLHYQDNLSPNQPVPFVYSRTEKNYSFPHRLFCIGLQHSLIWIVRNDFVRNYSL